VSPFGRCHQCDHDAILRMNAVAMCREHFTAALREAGRLRELLEGDE